MQHSEQNQSTAGVTHFLQIWLVPNQQGIDPGYEQKHFNAAEKRGHLRLVASADARDGAVRIHADAAVYAGLFDGAEAAELALAAGRCAYVHVVRGSLSVNGQAVIAGDAERAGHEFQRIRLAARRAGDIGIECHAGHGLTCDTAREIAVIPEIVELNIGHFLVGEAVFIGLEAAVRTLRAAMDEGRANA